MHRLSVLFHYIVSYIDQIVDRADSYGGKSSLHPFRRRPYLYILDYPRAVSRTEVCVLYGHFDIVIYIFFIPRRFHLRRYKLFAECSCRLPGDAYDTVAVYSVGRHFVLKDNIVKAEQFHGICSRLCLFGKDIDAFLRRLRVHVPVGTQFLDGAHHTVALHPAQLSFLDLNSACYAGSRLMSACHAPACEHYRYLVAFLHIAGARDDLYGAIPDIHLTDNKLIRVRMLFYLVDLPDDDFIQIRIQFFVSFHLRPGQCHRIGIFLRICLKPRHIRFDP